LVEDGAEREPEAHRGGEPAVDLVCVVEDPGKVCAPLGLVAAVSIETAGFLERSDA
jgi:hypothetical protein